MCVRMHICGIGRRSPLIVSMEHVIVQLTRTRAELLGGSGRRDALEARRLTRPIRAEQQPRELNITRLEDRWRHSGRNKTVVGLLLHVLCELGSLTVSQCYLRLIDGCRGGSQWLWDSVASASAGAGAASRGRSRWTWKTRHSGRTQPGRPWAGPRSRRACGSLLAL